MKEQESLDQFFHKVCKVLYHGSMPLSVLSTPPRFKETLLPLFPLLLLQTEGIESIVRQYLVLTVFMMFVMIQGVLKEHKTKDKCHCGK